ncbi:protoporphyrinogen oxidase [Aeoliella sp. SH292]|uniref:protoporphyrinogen oxidase n=1 Tax=Aeoliella sp. SH292 TaxID=3454464 RepID=UPI003F9D904E
MSPASLIAGSKPPIAIVGGGISGLAAAHRLTELLPDWPIKLFEASSRLGGVLHTEHAEGYLIEHSADNFLTRLPWAKELCERVGIAKELLPTEPSLRRALVVNRGQVVPVPEAFVLMSARKLWPVLTSPVLSAAGKLRLAMEAFVAKRTDSTDESVASFARRRLGREAFEQLVQPLVAGIYTADPELLSMQATLPQFVEMEQKFGSLWRGTRGQASGTDSGAQYSAFVAPRGGMGQLVDAIAERLPPGSVELNTAIERVQQTDSGAWQLQTTSGQRIEAAAVVIATPAPRAAKLLSLVDEPLSKLLGSIRLASTAIVVLGVERAQVAKPIPGFGFVVPQVEGRQIIAASFSSVKFPDRAPDGRLLIRVFIGGALQPELLERSDAELVSLARQELRELVGLTGEPDLTNVVRWPASMPQYHVGHLDRVMQIEQLTAQHPGLAIAGNAYRGVGIPQCIRSGEQAAQQIADHLLGA